MSANVKKCERCTKTIFIADKYENYEGKVYHTGCFKCSNEECGIKLTTRTVRGYNKIPYCQKHLPNSTSNQTIVSNEVQNECPPLEPRVPISNQKFKSYSDNEEHKYENVIPTPTKNQDECPSLEPRVPIPNQKSVSCSNDEEHKYANIIPISTEVQNECPPLEPRVPISNQSVYYAKVDEDKEEPIYLNINDDDEIDRANAKSIRKQMQNALKESSETMVDDIFNDLSNDMHIIVCGPPRVGKSTLINAICGVKLARAEEGIDSVTQEIQCYKKQGQINTGSKIVNYQYNVWDTPGFESWESKSVKEKIKEILSKPENKPVCMIFCASPNSFADTEQLEWLLDLFINEKHIFCALVCTDKYSGQKKKVDALLNTYDRLLSKYVAQPAKTTNDVTFYGNVGLTAMVNSEPYEDSQGNILPTEGVNELIQGILESLVDEKMIQWCLVVLENQDFWENCQNKFEHFVHGVKGKMKRFAKFLKLKQK